MVFLPDSFFIRVLTVEKIYGNRIQPIYRWAVGSLVAVSLIFLMAAAIGGLVSPLPATIIIILGLAFVVIYGRAGTVISADSDSVQVQLPPLWRKRIWFKDIESIVVEPIKPIEREWGNRGSLKREGQIFIDAGQSKTCLAFYLADGTVIRLGVSSPEHGADIADILAPRREESSTAID